MLLSQYFLGHNEWNDYRNNEWLGLSLSPESIDGKLLHIWWGNSCISGICVNYNMSKIYVYKLLAHSEDENFIVD